MMRSRFEQQLVLLNNEMIKMGSLCENAIAMTAKALLEGDVKLIKEVSHTEELIDEKEREIEALCLKLLLQQQPVASDLRVISSALKMITDMERIGDQAADIEEIMLTEDITSGEDLSYVAEMARATIKMVTESIDAFVNKDINTVNAVISYDDIVDESFYKTKTALAGMLSKGDEEAQRALDILLIAKYFERIGDHAVNIAEWVSFSITGKHKEG